MELYASAVERNGVNENATVGHFGWNLGSSLSSLRLLPRGGGRKPHAAWGRSHVLIPVLFRRYLILTAAIILMVLN